MSGPTVGVFDPSLFVTVAVESHSHGDEIHFHAGGQGLWVARMIAVLGGRPTLCTALGDESGDVLRALLRREEIELRSPETASRNGAYVDDRRSGERERLAEGHATVTPLRPVSAADDVDLDRLLAERLP